MRAKIRNKGYMKDNRTYTRGGIDVVCTLLAYEHLSRIEIDTIVTDGSGASVRAAGRTTGLHLQFSPTDRSSILFLTRRGVASYNLHTHTITHTIYCTPSPQNVNSVYPFVSPTTFSICPAASYLGVFGTNCGAMRMVDAHSGTF